MAWSIAQVAVMSQVTSRTLRHYDDIGLLPPAYIGGNGYRYYQREELERLQEILLLRELGLGLGAVAEVLDGRTSRVDALRRHEASLRTEGARLARLADTVARTVAHLEGGPDMPAEEMFEGFAVKTRAMEEELVQQHGECVRAHFRTAEQVTSGWTKADYSQAKDAGDALDRRLEEVHAGGAAPDSPEAMNAVAEHYASVARFWTPNRDSYTGLGHMYVDSPDFRAHYDAVGPGLAEWLREAITAYAQTHLD